MLRTRLFKNHYNHNIFLRMKKRVLLTTLLLLVGLSSAAPIFSDYYTRHNNEDLTLMRLSLNINSEKTYVNEFGEKELVFDSKTTTGAIEVVSSVKSKVLIKNVFVFKVKINKNPPYNSIDEPISAGIDEKSTIEPRIVQIANGNTGISLQYNPLSQECGNNYLVVFTVSNPAVNPSFEKTIGLRFHIPCKTDLLVVSSSLMGQPTSEFALSMRDYIKTIASKNKLVRIVTLPQSSTSYSTQYANSFDFEPLPNQEQDARAQRVRKELDRLRAIHKPSYLLLIGSINHIPMPFLTDERIPTGIIPSDSLYTFNGHTNRVEIPVARIPIPIGEDDPGGFASQVILNARHTHTAEPIGDKITILSDNCGKENNCFLRKSTEDAAKIYWNSCENNPACLFSDPHCAISSKNPNCIGNEQIRNAIGNSRLLYINAHSGTAELVATNQDGKTFKIISPGEIASGENYNNELIVSSLACFTGSIDKFADGQTVRRETGITFAFLQTGSPLVLANTRVGYGSFENGQMFEHNNLVLAALKRKDGRPIADIFVEQLNEQINSGDAYTLSSFSTQIYGDPLLPVYRG